MVSAYSFYRICSIERWGIRGGGGAFKGKKPFVVNGMMWPLQYCCQIAITYQFKDITYQFNKFNTLLILHCIPFSVF